MQAITRYLAAVRYLRPIQVQGRLRLLLQRKGLHRSRLYRAAYQRCATGKEAATPLPLLPATHPVGNVMDDNRPEELAHNRFTFLNRTVDLGSPIRWLPAGEAPLWQYNLHYFHYAVTLGNAYAYGNNLDAYPLFRRLVQEWMAGCPVATPVAWDAYPTSLRMTNWIKAYTLFAPLLRKDDAFAAQLRQSLFVQASFLEHHIEYHLMGNHLLENGRALLLAGLFFTDSRTQQTTRRWQAKGKAILWGELAEQFLADGGHFERSPMYHHLYLHLYQEVIALLQAQGQLVPATVEQRVAAMADWLGAVLHPDGNIPLLNDAVFGMVKQPPRLPAAQITPVHGLKALADSGYFVFRDRDAQHFLIFDCGPLGPDYFPSHGHCDALSYELSLAGQRFIVDAGVENYDGDQERRLYYRSTRAHNTVVVDEAEQSEIWDRYRVARRAHPLAVGWSDDGADLAYVVGAHTGYQRLPGKVTHRRWLCWVDRRFWLVCDLLTGQGRHRIESLIHFHPAVAVMRTPDPQAGQPGGAVCCAGITLQLVTWGAQTVTSYYGNSNPLQGWVAPDFGLEMKNIVWGLGQEIALPAWSGYVLWPGQEALTVAYAPTVAANGDQQCRITVTTADRTYQLVCTNEGARVE